MPSPSHRLPRALLLSVGLHLGVGLWLWTRSEPEAPPPAPLQVPMELQFVEVDLPLKAALPQPGAGPTTPSRRIPALRSPHRSPTPLPEAAASTAPREAQGGVHPYFHTLGRSVLQHWNPEHYLAVKGFEGTFESTVSAQHELARVMSDGAEADASADAPLDSPTRVRDRRALRQKTKDRLRTSRRATVRVIQEATGKVVAVWVISSSHDRYLDVVTVDGVKRAAERQPPLPPKAAQGRELWTSLWQMELIVAKSPPEPTADPTFDAEMELTEIHLPPDLHLYKRVRLLEVR